MTVFRPLSNQEIGQLERQGCLSSDWTKIQVSQDFQTAQLLRSSLNGNIKIDSGAIIVNSSLTMEGTSAFGNGTKTTILDESGSRALILTQEMTAQNAYLQCFWKQDEQTTAYLYQLFCKNADSFINDTMVVGRGAAVRHCVNIENVQIGPFAILNGVQHISDGTILSSEDSPTILGDNVIAHHFIMAKGAQLTDGALIERCFIGENALVSKQFSATDSVIFANCQLTHGEATAFFAGPSTISHHKNTLLIAGATLFFNAGSGSNESNHMYKSGPIHYGILDRGSKMASDSYIPWPSRTGCFSLIIGKHKNKLNTKEFPFSYLSAEGTLTRIIPAISLRNLGTFRDVSKWPDRDNRKNPLADSIIYDFLNPFIISQILSGYLRLQDLLEKDQEEFLYPFEDKHIYITRKSAERGIELYQKALLIYCGIHAEKGQVAKIEPWMDVCGLITPYRRIQRIIRRQPDSLKVLNEELQKLTLSYQQDNKRFASALAGILLNKKVLETDDISSLRNRSKKEIDSLKTEVLLDAKKEYEHIFKINFGVDQGKEAQEKEFGRLRGTLDKEAICKLIDNALNTRQK